MVEGAGGARFPPEALQGLLVFSQLFGEELQGDGPAQLGVLGLVDHTHAAPAEFLQDAVVGDGLADHRQDPSLNAAILGREGGQVNAKGK